MKKSLIALAVLAAAGAASAQSSVTLFGVVDATLAWGRGTGVGSSDRFQMTNSGYNSSRLGFRGTEDLGGGMSASFWLEAGVNNDDGQGFGSNSNNQASGAGAAVAGRQGLTFNRRSTVSLGGGWGEVRLGRDYSPQFWNLTVFDPFGTNGVGTNQMINSIITGVTAIRASNSIGYFLPANLGGFYGQVQYYLGENVQNGATTEDDGRGLGVRFGYATGPVNVAIALSRTDAAAAPGGTDDIRQNNIGFSWDFGVAKPMIQLSRDRSGALDARGFLVGSLFPVGAGEIRLAYSNYRTEEVVVGAGEPSTRKIAIGYVHNLSKRTAVYTTYARLRNRNGAAQALNGSVTAASESSSGLDIGIRHSF
jgi:predicted porin